VIARNAWASFGPICSAVAAGDHARPGDGEGDGPW
jgi:hypothetical protein